MDGNSDRVGTSECSPPKGSISCTQSNEKVCSRTKNDLMGTRDAVFFYRYVFVEIVKKP